jgi:hypothetical protein
MRVERGLSVDCRTGCAGRVTWLSVPHGGPSPMSSSSRAPATTSPVSFRSTPSTARRASRPSSSTAPRSWSRYSLAEDTAFITLDSWPLRQDEEWG